MTTHAKDPTYDCTDIKALLSALVDGVTTEPQRHAAERHLAECVECRAVLGEAERNEELLALAAVTGGLPTGFEEHVLARTIGPSSAGARFRSWLGWIAAAASLGLAGTLLALERASNRAAARPVVQASLAYAPGPELRSSIRSASEPIVQAPLFREAAAPPRRLARDASEALDSTSMLMNLLARSDVETFADVEQVRRIAEYEELLPRLARARAELPASDRPAVWAAESMLYRVVRGPLSLDDVREMRQSVSAMELQQRLEDLGSRPEIASTL